MKKVERQKGAKVILLALAIALVMTIITLLLSGRAFVLTGAVNTILKPGRALMDSLAGWAEQQFSEVEEIDALREENTELKRRIAEMESDARDLQDIKDENDRLNELLEFSKKHKDFSYEKVTLVAWGSSNWTSEFTISKGTEAEIEVYDCVVTESGYLVGIVSEVGVGWSTVKTIIDTDFSMGVLVYETSETAVAEGDLTLMEQGYLRMSYIPSDSELKTGDTVMTSGLGNMYPKELVIGKVATVGVDSSGLTEYAVIKPEADLSSISSVYVITDYEITE